MKSIIFYVKNNTRPIFQTAQCSFSLMGKDIIYALIYIMRKSTLLVLTSIIIGRVILFSADLVAMFILLLCNLFCIPTLVNFFDHHYSPQVVAKNKKRKIKQTHNRQ